MAIPASGTLTFAQIQTEFGGSNPIGLNEYYRGGAYVPNIPANSAIPTSGAIALSNFYNSTGIFNFTYSITSNFANFNLNTVMTANGWNGTAPVIANVTINAGVTVYGVGYSGTAGFTVGSLPALSTVAIINNGTIAGYGGFGAGTATAGGAGGVALSISYPTTLTNNNFILGGGGGGGGGGAGPEYGLPFEGGAGGAGGAAIQIYNNLTITNNGLIGGGGGGGGGGGSTAFNDCGAYLYMGGGGGAGGRTGSVIVASFGGAFGGNYFCSSYVNTNPTSGENGLTVQSGGTPYDVWTSGSPIPGSGGQAYLASPFRIINGGTGGRGGSENSSQAAWAAAGLNGNTGSSFGYFSTNYGGGAGGAGGAAVITSGGTLTVSTVGTIYGAY
jgi:hypothetical protein